MDTEYKKFFSKGIIFITTLFLVTLFINKVYFDFVLQKQQTLRKEVMYQDFIKDLPQKEITYAFFGDSHTRNGVNPKYISNSYNFSDSGENYIKSYFKLKKILELDKIKIDNLILEIDMHTFSTRFTDEDRLFDVLYYYSGFVPYSEIAKIKNESVPKIWIDANFPSFGNGEDFINIFVKPDLTEIYRGWTKSTEDFSLLDKKKKAYVIYDFHFVGQKRISAVSFEYFTKTLELAKKNNIKLFFIMYPVSEEYAKELASHGITRDDYYGEIMDRIHSIFKNNYSILNYYDVFFKHPEYFSDADHLNYVGAKILSQQIFADLRKIKN